MFGGIKQCVRLFGVACVWGREIETWVIVKSIVSLLLMLDLSFSFVLAACFFYGGKVHDFTEQCVGEHSEREPLSQMRSPPRHGAHTTLEIQTNESLARASFKLCHHSFHKVEIIALRRFSKNEDFIEQ
jgi:hypothetical protein